MRTTLPSTTTRFFWTFGIQSRFVRFLACETLWPKLRCLPVIAHFIRYITFFVSHNWRTRDVSVR